MLSIIIINYNTTSLLLSCIESIYRSTQDTPFEIIVVDNQSDDDARPVVQHQFPGVRWIAMGYNAGFARANNQGMLAARGDLLLLLNPDTVVHNGALDGCVQQLTRSDAIACGVQLLNEDGSLQMSGWHFGWRGISVLVKLPYMKQLYDKIRKKPVNLAVKEGADPVKVDFINGAFLMVKRNALDKAGLLDEAFFLYSEEAEWCSRLSKSGPLRIFGGLYVTHLQGEAANEAFSSTGKGYFNLFDRKGLQFMVSEWLRITKQYGKFTMLLYFLIYFFYSIPLLFIWFADFCIRFGSPSYRFQECMAFAANNFRCIPWVLKMTGRKEHFYKVL